MRQLVDLISKLPPWTQWSAQADSIVGSAISDLQGLQLASKSDDEKLSLPDQADDHSETINKMLAEQLVELNGNVVTLTHTDVERSKPHDKFTFVLTQWLSCVSSPRDRSCHVQDETGVWITDDELRERLRHGDVLHIPERVVKPATWSRFSRALVEVPQTATASENEKTKLLLDDP